MSFKKKFLLYKEIFFILSAILILVFLSFSPVLKAKFVWDDSLHVLDNISVQSLSFLSIKSMFTETVAGVYIPLTTLSFAIEHHFFGFNFLILHLTNLLLHLFNVCMVYFLGKKLQLPLMASAVAALIFGLHPMHVESVAWVSERKDVLYAAFYLLAVWQYLHYCETKRIKNCIFSLAFGLLSVLAKAMALSLPLVLAALDWYTKQKINKRVILEKAAYFLYIIPIVLITYLLHARVPIQNIGEAVLIYIWSFVFYIYKFFWPITLVPIYVSSQPITLTNPVYGFSLVFFALIALSLWIFRRERLYIFAWVFYYCSIFFLLRMDVGIDLTIVADRFMYLPSLGFCYFLGNLFWRGYEKASSHPSIQLSCMMIFVVLLSALSVKTFYQARIWKDNLSLWDYEVKKVPDSPIAYHNRGVSYHDEGMYVEALKDLNKTLLLSPKYETAYYNRAQVYFKLNEWDKAFLDLNTALVLNKEASDAYRLRAYMYFRRGNLADALADLNQALMFQPEYFKLYKDRANVYLSLGEKEKALKDYNQAVSINPWYGAGFIRRGHFFMEEHQDDIAMKDFRRALELNPREPMAHVLMGIIYRDQKQFEKALDSFNLALKIKENLKFALEEKARLYEQMGEQELARAQLEKINPTEPEIIDQMLEYEY